MLKFNLMMSFYFILFYFSSIAQPTDSLNSTDVVTISGLIFEKEIEYLVGDSSYTDVIQLVNLCDKAQAMQFRLLINKAPDDSTILIFKDIQKGSDLSDPSWLLDYNVIKGPSAKNGASQDEIFVVLYNLNYNSGLMPGDYNNLFNVNYALPGIIDLEKDIKSSIKISHAEASTFEGNAIDIKPTRNELKIYLK
ncbi:MAG TPA: hypothetical protein VIZ21_01520 [Ignavibacteriaceae bacterium]